MWTKWPGNIPEARGGGRMRAGFSTIQSPRRPIAPERSCWRVESPGHKGVQSVNAPRHFNGLRNTNPRIIQMIDN